MLTALFTLLWTLLFIVPGIIAAIRYSQAYFILRDNPGIGGLEAIRRSKVMMDGNKGRFFVFCLSYIGWFFLGALACGIGTLWAYTYFFTGLAHFHEDLIRAADPEPPNPYTPGAFNPY